MASFIISSGQSSNSREVPHITFTHDDAKGIHYPHCDALIIRAVMAINGPRRMLVDNRSSINIIYGSTHDKMVVDHELIPVAPTIRVYM